jgi:hypothetical protein
MVFFSRDTSAIPTFTYDGTLWNLSLNSNTLKSILLVMEVYIQKMADNFRYAIARVYRIGDSKGVEHRKHAMLCVTSPGLRFDS